MPKYIFVTGGVVSSVGKGITVASTGCILKSRGFPVSIQKLDPYLNVDPGTMRPYQHGEVFVTDDGAETDLDLGHYERFIDEDLTRDNNVTTGQIYASDPEGAPGRLPGGYGAGDPPHHQRDQGAHHPRRRQSGADVVIVEVGGTVGDIESQHFLEAIRQMRKDVGRSNVYYVHVTLVPHLGATGEMKTKPTQHSVQELRRIGIQPDAIVCRSDRPWTRTSRRRSPSTRTSTQGGDVPADPERDLRGAAGPGAAGFGDDIIAELGLQGVARPKDLREWREMVERLQRGGPPLRVALVGKYTQLHDAYICVTEALDHAGLHHGRELELTWINSEELEERSAGPGYALSGPRVTCGWSSPGGSAPGHRGQDQGGPLRPRAGVPYFGLCHGMQMACSRWPGTCWTRRGPTPPRSTRRRRTR